MGLLLRVFIIFVFRINRQNKSKIALCLKVNLVIIENSYAPTGTV